MKYITTTGTLINAEGFIEGHGVTVLDHGDTISIGRSEFLKSDLIVSDTEIVSKNANPPWLVQI